MLLTAHVHKWTIKLVYHKCSWKVEVKKSRLRLATLLLSTLPVSVAHLAQRNRKFYLFCCRFFFSLFCGDVVGEPKINKQLFWLSHNFRSTSVKPIQDQHWRANWISAQRIPMIDIRIRELILHSIFISIEFGWSSSRSNGDQRNPKSNWVKWKIYSNSWWN